MASHPTSNTRKRGQQPYIKIGSHIQVADTNDCTSLNKPITWETESLFRLIIFDWDSKRSANQYSLLPALLLSSHLISYWHSSDHRHTALRLLRNIKPESRSRRNWKRFPINRRAPCNTIRVHFCSPSELIFWVMRLGIIIAACELYLDTVLKWEVLSNANCFVSQNFRRS